MLAESTACRPHYHPFESVYTAGNSMDYIVDTKKQIIIQQLADEIMLSSFRVKPTIWITII